MVIQVLYGFMASIAVLWTITLHYMTAEP
jgi:hypothetical protein